jgi:hypothetical protein
MIEEHPPSNNQSEVMEAIDDVKADLQVMNE